LAYPNRVGGDKWFLHLLFLLITSGVNVQETQLNAYAQMRGQNMNGCENCR
jgi:hypothetical protein